jgi:hypothetical protein
MPVARFSVTMDPELGAAVRAAAENAGMTVSEWVSQAVADRVRNELLGIWLDQWDAEDGPPTEEEMEQARRDLGFPSCATGAQ